MKEEYVLLYVPLQNNPEYSKVAHEYAKQHKCKVVEISFYLRRKWTHTVFADAGIEEFLSLLEGAKAVFTNSFHAVCFSCLYHKEFYAFERKTGRKTEDLCKRFGLSDRYMPVSKFHECDLIDYSKVDKKLNEERSFSIEWLKEQINDK